MLAHIVHDKVTREKSEEADYILAVWRDFFFLNDDQNETHILLQFYMLLTLRRN